MIRTQGQTLNLMSVNRMSFCSKSLKYNGPLFFLVLFLDASFNCWLCPDKSRHTSRSCVPFSSQRGRRPLRALLSMEICRCQAIVRLSDDNQRCTKSSSIYYYYYNNIILLELVVGLPSHT